MSEAPNRAEWLNRPGFALQITGRCNVACSQCLSPSGQWDRSAEEILDSAGRLAAQGYEWVGLCGGEPTLHPDLEAIVECVRELGLRVCLASNGTNRERLKDLPIDALSVCAWAEGWTEMAALRGDIPVSASISVVRDGGEDALERAVAAARNGFARAVFLPHQPKAAHQADPDRYPDFADLNLLLLAEPWLSEMGLAVVFGCAALRTLGIVDECPEDFRAVDLGGEARECLYFGCPHYPGAEEACPPVG